MFLKITGIDSHAWSVEEAFKSIWYPSTLSRSCIEVYVINKAFSKRQMGIKFSAVTSQILNDKKKIK